MKRCAAVEVEKERERERERESVYVISCNLHIRFYCQEINLLMLNCVCKLKQPAYSTQSDQSNLRSGRIGMHILPVWGGFLARHASS